MSVNINIEERTPLILMVDDTPANLQVLGGILSTEKYEIAAATNGTQALEIIEEISPDLILLDIMMPDIDGYEVCKRIKENDKTRDIPIIFITAKTATEDIVKGFELGAVDYVLKPFNAVELLSRIKTHLKIQDLSNRQKTLIDELSQALEHVKSLSGLLPLCSHCKKVRDDDGYWQQVDNYLADYSEAEVSHSICPDCAVKYYPDLDMGSEDD